AQRSWNERSTLDRFAPTRPGPGARMADGGEAVVQGSLRRTTGGGWVSVVEQVTWRALLGIRFWEHGLDRPVGGGLVVRAYALDAHGAPMTAVRPVQALPNPQGVYVFHALPGRGAPSLADGSGSVAIEVWDPEGRFLPV